MCQIIRHFEGCHCQGSRQRLGSCVGLLCYRAHSDLGERWWERKVARGWNLDQGHGGGGGGWLVPGKKVSLNQGAEASGLD